MTKKKSIFEKWGLVESSSDEDFNEEEVLASLRAQSAELEGEVTESTSVTSTSIVFEEDENFLTVAEVYEKAGLSDTSRSIFKVEEFSKHIPDNLPTDVKRQSVIGILSASGLQLDELLEDAENRIQALKETLSLTSQKSDQDIMEKDQEITNLLNMVDSLKQDILDRKSAQEQQNDFVNEELEKISQILKFVSAK